jgi:hypothetical protein
MPFLVSWKTDIGTRTVSLKKWKDLDYLVNTLKVKEFSIEVFEYTRDYKPC